MRYLTTGLAIAALLAALAGCGQMGPLYMPPEEDTSNAAPVEQSDKSQQAAGKS